MGETKGGSVIDEYEQAELVRNALNDAGYERAQDITNREAVAAYRVVADAQGCHADTERLEAIYWLVMERTDAMLILVNANARMGEHYIDAARRFVDAVILPEFRSSAPTPQEGTPHGS